MDGPEMTKVLKSKRIWHTSELHLQISVAQTPLAKAEASKYVPFSEVVEPHPKVTERLKNS